ncbi:acyltransferase family protein [Sphingobacterium sp. HJSM2_6]|uniref:acyltransferase family protein n=1 Tax=Sphingobacterium sp. HJSM2_6 TaxID=3366264 RepID=UPI003BE5D6D3
MKLEGLQVVRGSAATLVAVGHIYNDGWIPKAIVDFGGFRIDLFFAMSGFILCLTMRSLSPSRLINLKTYFVKKIIRIFPAYLLCALPLIAYVTLKTDIQSPFYYLGNLLLLPSFTNDPNYSLALPTAWTLVYELLFFGLFLLGIILFNRKDYILIFIFIALVLTISLVNFFKLQGPRLSWVNLSYIMGHLKVLNFASGMLIYKIFIKIKQKDLFNITQWTLIVLFSSFILIRLHTLELSNDYIKVSFVFIIILVTTLTKNDFSKHKFGRILLLLGNASFSIYLTHFYFAFFKPKVLLIGNYLPFNNEITLNIIDFGLLGSALIAGIYFYQLIEKPMTKFLKSN